uniref:DNA polymerase delta subunit 4 n=1 Tax=Aegilops tauschii subsp. strangulata TaxID=200361 RepID=A0A453L536_AEGTS
MPTPMQVQTPLPPKKPRSKLATSSPSSGSRRPTPAQRPPSPPAASPRSRRTTTTRSKRRRARRQVRRRTPNPSSADSYAQRGFDHHGDGADARREEAENAERKAREFDMDMRYGPCLGLTRAQRWQRAAALGLAPPPHALCSDDQPCLWEVFVCTFVSILLGACDAV